MSELARRHARMRYMQARYDGAPPREKDDAKREYLAAREDLAVVFGALEESGIYYNMKELEENGLQWFMSKIGVMPERAAAMERVSVDPVPREQHDNPMRRMPRVIPPLVKAPVPEEPEPEVEDTLERVRGDFIFFCSECIYITYRPGMNPDFPDGGFGPLILTDAQKIIVAELIHDFFIAKVPIRYIILKSRQLGCTTLLLAFWVWLCLTISDWKMMFIIDKGKHLIVKREMIKKWIKMAVEKYPSLGGGGIEKVEESIIILRNRSIILFESAEAPNPGTSEMLNGLHESEKPKWPSNRAEQVQNSILPGIPHTRFTCHINESTAEGMDSFFVEWKRAVEDTTGTGHKPIFLPWFISKEYATRPPEECFSEDGKFIYLNDDNEVSEVDDNGDHLYTEEGYSQHYRLTPSQTYWRRIKIKVTFKGNRNSFDQEYPTTAAHAWRAVSTSFFPREKLDQAQQNSVKPPKYVGRLRNRNGLLDASRPVLFSSVMPEMLSDRNGDLKVWELPQTGKKYFLGGDTAEGKTVVTDTGNTDPDKTVFFVMDEEGRQVAQYRSHIKPEEAWIPLLLLARFYNDAAVNVELNGQGRTLLTWFYQTGYPNNLVWPTPRGRPTSERMWTSVSKGNRTEFLATLRASFNADYSRIVSEDLLSELRAFIVDGEKGTVAAARGHHDDIVFAGAHAETCRLFCLGLLKAYGIENLGVEEPEIIDTTKDPNSPDFAGFKFLDGVTDIVLNEDEVW
jgi:hypothetical protein